MPSAAFTLVTRMLAERSNEPLLQEPVVVLRSRLDDKLRRLSRRNGRSLLPVSPCQSRLFWVQAGERIDFDRVLLFVHGGAFCSGSAELYSGMAGSLSDATRARTAAVQYRLAPEHPFPAALEDVEHAYRFLVQRVTAPEQLVVAGDSAGGCLALAALVRLKQRGIPMPATIVLTSPWVDLTVSGSSIKTNTERDPVVQATGLRRLARTYLAGKQPHDPMASPLFADLSGLPPCLIQVGMNEVLLSDSTRLAQALANHGGQVELDVRQDMFHGFYVMSELPEAQTALADIGRFVAARFSDRLRQSGYEYNGKACL